ncbi:thiamine pyrophosphate-binding protein [Methylovirgula sp. 4M-Z18]|uniref:thiamine pyrophosphate-binding protein n=1 Tax=Methylovirgula sp. 4M-Z18 TaxID=2293567 RepID=UPI000E2EF142|nr:thiamine pyrophosphate-binding protein [Methylovirgula sp. 4M-Z18]RFB79931.1 thiamine pyrophosphate-binding protein [Methylovirgula sp. 4M-Z18]
MTTGADIIATHLYAAGCRHAFGIPGGEVLALVDALDRAGLAFHLAKHENAAGFMAEGVWHATGEIGVLVATLGPGVTNAINVVANAWQDRVPLIFLTGRVDPAEAETFTHQILDHQAVLRPVVKASLMATRGAVAACIAKAIAIARDGQPGPVHVDVPIGVAEGEERESGLKLRAPVAPAAPAPGPALEEARQWLQAAQRPLVIAGVDAINHNAHAAIADFCRAQQVPLLTTYKAKGILPETDALALGGAGLSPKADRILLPLVAAADVILLAGYDPIEMRIGWRDPWPDTARVIDLCAVPPTHFMHAAAKVFVGDIGASLHALSQGLTMCAHWPPGRIAQARADLVAAFAPEAEWGPGVVFDVIRRVAPSETVITADSGAHRILLSQMWTCPAPHHFLQSTGLCTMGCALPLATGYKLARPQSPVIAVMGDACLEMVLGELATLRDLKLPVVLVVLVDETLALIAQKQRAMQKKRVGVDFGGTDFADVAAAMGGTGVWVEDRVTLASEMRNALKRHGRFTLLACRISKNAYEGRI